MIKITKLRLKNFKSFRKAEIPFADGFTAIVGSNASGKSNLLDAIMFVFGATSLKTLRAARLTDLIHHDASEDYAKVEIEIEDKEKNIKHEISRIIDSQGRSVYKLDGKRKTMDEVCSMLEELGISAKGHNIVAQGDITRIIEMSPKQRREIIDEIAGLSEFDEKKNEALDKLAKVEQRIKDANIVLREREAYLQQLEKEKNAALRSIELTEELKRSKATIIAKEISRVKASIELLSKKEAKIKEQLEEKNTERQKTNEELQYLNRKLEETTDKLLKAKETIYSTIGKNIESKKAEIKVNSERIMHTEAKINSAKARSQSLKEKIRHLEETIAEKENNVNKISTEIFALENELKPLEEIERAQFEKLHNYEEKINTTEKELKILAEKLLEANNNFYEMEIEAATIRKELELISERIKKIEEMKNTFQIEEKKAIIAKLDVGLKEITKILEKWGREPALKFEINVLIEKIKSLALELKELQSLIDQIYAKEEEEQLKILIQQNEKRLAEIEMQKEEAHNCAHQIEKEIAEKEIELKKLRIFETTTTNEKLRRLREQKAILAERLATENSAITELKKRIEELRLELAEIEKEIESTTNLLLELSQKDISLRHDLEERERKLEKALCQYETLEKTKQNYAEKIEKLNKKTNEIYSEIERLRKDGNEISIELSKETVRLEDLNQEYKNYEGIKIIENANVKELEKKILKIETELQELGPINMKALQDFDHYYAEVENVRQKSRILEEERKAVIEMIDKIELKKINVFMECFNSINENFGKLYYEFFSGEGRLGLTLPENPLEGGLTIEAKYSEEKLKSIDAMSGGEKALTALAFLFAIQSYLPAPFYIFDEADAALDRENSLKLANLIKGLSRKSQFIVITHNDVLTKMADQLIGVALNKKKSSVVGLRLKEYLTQMKKPLDQLEESDFKNLENSNVENENN